MNIHEHNSSQAHKPEEVEVKHSPSAALNHPELAEPSFRDEEVKFTFKKKKSSETDIAGAEPERRAPVTLTLPVLTGSGLIAAIGSDEKVFNFVVDLVNDAIREAARAQVSDEENPVNRQSELDLTKLSLQFIANQPKSERGGGISKETWAEFEKDYVEVMVRVSGREKPRIEKAAAIFTKRLTPVQGDKKVLKFLQEQLAMWAANTTQSEDLGEVFVFLDGKITTLLQKDSSALLENL